MPELETRLRALASDVEWPETPALADALVLERPRRRVPRRALVIALAIVAVALAAAFAVPDARTSILRLFHLGGVTVERVDRLPEARPLGDLHLGAPVSLAEARLRLGQPILLPDGDRPDATYFDGALAAGGVNLRYGEERRPRLLVSEFLTANLPLIEKYVRLEAPIEQVDVNGNVGMWIPKRHVARIGALPPRLSTSALVWSN